MFHKTFSQGFTMTQVLESSKQEVRVLEKKDSLGCSLILNSYVSSKINKHQKVVRKKNAKQSLDFAYCKKGSFDVGIFYLKTLKSTLLKIEISKDLLVATTPITQGVWRSVMGFNPAYHRKREITVYVSNDHFDLEADCVDRKILIEKDLNRPIENITWFDAIAFCNKLSEMQGLSPYYKMTEIKYDGQLADFKYRVLSNSKESPKKRSRHIIAATVTRNIDSDGYRLPTFAEMQFFVYEESKKVTESPTNADTTLFRDQDFYPKPVGQGRPNALGLYDLNDNVCEMLYDYNIYDNAKWETESRKLDRSRPYLYLKLPHNYVHRVPFGIDKKDKKFLKSLTSIKDPVIEPIKKKPSAYDYVEHFLSGNTNFLSKLPENPYVVNSYSTYSTNRCIDTSVAAQFARNESVGFRIVRNVKKASK